MFLPEINNELPVKNAVYKANLAALEKLVLFRFKNDITVVPRNSAWFAKAVGKEEIKLEDTNLWQVNASQSP